MKIRFLLDSGRPLFSCEVFPPKRDGEVEPLYLAFEELRSLQPDYISVTYGAGGSNAGLHYEINLKLLDLGLTPLAHFTCVGQGHDAILRQLERLRQAGVENVLALRGDAPKGAARFERPADGFGYASELIAFIRRHFDFCVGAACYPEKHPEAASAKEDLRRLKEKVDAGAEFLITQFFFDNSLYFDFVQCCRLAGIVVPILPGVMPVLTPKFFARDWGVRYPAELGAGFQGEDATAHEAHGIRFAVAQCAELWKNGAPGLHLYIMNKSRTARQILQALPGYRS